MASLALHPVFSIGGDLPDDTAVAALLASAKKFRRPSPPSFDEFTASICVYLLQHPKLEMFKLGSLAEKVKNELKRNYDIDWSYEKVYEFLDMLRTVVAEGL
jgi:hypothetical protein